ncbi:TPA: hypothetical protein ACQQJB_003543 [Pseudomonas aeruginosa]
MKKSIAAVSVLALLSLAGCASQSQIDEKNRLAAANPAIQAADFAAQFYGVKSETVSVLLFDQSANQVKAQTRSPDGRFCHLDMVSAPGAQTPKGWLMRSVQCDVPNIAG